MKKYIDDIKPYMPMVLLIPAVLGGIWQLFELSKMSISYIRFFSATQLLPDGLIILTLLFTIYLANKVSSLYINDFKNKNRDNIRKKPISFTNLRPSYFNSFTIKKVEPQFLTYLSMLDILKNKSYYIKRILLGLVIIILIVILIFSTNTNLNLLTLTSALFAITIIGKITYVHISILYFVIYKRRLDISGIIHEDTSNKDDRVIGISLIIVIFILLAEFPTLLHKKLFIPNNLINLKNIESTLNNSEYNSSKILYMNDKYIFIEHLKNTNIPSKSVIQIINFKDLFPKK